jgi:hypothetical protein
VPLEEKIEILVALCGDDNDSIRDTAFKTLQGWNPGELKQLLADPSTPLLVLDFAVGYLAPGRRDVQEGLLGNPQLPDDLREWVQGLAAHDDVEASLAAAPSPGGPAPAVEESDLKDPTRETLLQRISRMSTAEKIKCALTGNQEERLALIRDSNKIVARAVLQSPKLSSQEIDNIASMTNVTEDVLRLIAKNRRFLKSYSVVHSLLNNPRAPLDVTLPLITRLNDRDLKSLSLNKNVPDVIRGMAVKFIRQKVESQKVKLPTKH